MQFVSIYIKRKNRGFSGIGFRQKAKDPKICTLNSDKNVKN